MLILERKECQWVVNTIYSLDSENQLDFFNDRISLDNYDPKYFGHKEEFPKGLSETKEVYIHQLRGDATTYYEWNTLDELLKDNSLVAQTAKKWLEEYYNQDQYWMVFE